MFDLSLLYNTILAVLTFVDTIICDTEDSLTWPDIKRLDLLEYY